LVRDSTGFPWRARPGGTEGELAVASQCELKKRREKGEAGQPKGEERRFISWICDKRARMEKKRSLKNRKEGRPLPLKVSRKKSKLSDGCSPGENGPRKKNTKEGGIFLRKICFHLKGGGSEMKLRRHEKRIEEGQRRKILDKTEDRDKKQKKRGRLKQKESTSML